jgi:hypothetical protein
MRFDLPRTYCICVNPQNSLTSPLSALSSPTDIRAVFHFFVGTMRRAIFVWSRTSVATDTGLRAGRPRVLFLADTMAFCLLDVAQTIPGTHSTYYPKVNGESFLGERLPLKVEVREH